MPVDLHRETDAVGVYFTAMYITLLCKAPERMLIQESLYGGREGSLRTPSPSFRIGSSMQQDPLHPVRLRRDSENGSPVLGSLSGSRHSIGDGSPLLSEGRLVHSPEQRTRRRLDHGPQQGT